MKTLIATIAMITSFSTFATGGLTSSGKDINCDINVRGTTEFYSCETSYGPSDKCHDFSAEALVSLSSLHGDLKNGLEGNLPATSVELTLPSASKSVNEKLIQTIQRNNLSAHVNYKNGVITLTLNSNLGTKTVSVAKDFSEGVRGAIAFVNIESAISASNPLNLSVQMYCQPTVK